MDFEKNSQLSIVIPAYNEEKRLPKTIFEIAKNLDAFPFKEKELIIVDDGSTDGTVQVAQKMARFCPGLRVVGLSKNRGKGYAVRSGVLEAKGDYILFSDADLSTPIFEAEKLLLDINKGGYDIAIGSRRLPDSQIEAPQPWYRGFCGGVFNMIVRMLVVQGVKDTQCGFKCFTQKSAKKIFGEQKLNGFSFDVEVLYLANKYGFSVKETPVIWRDSPQTSVKLLKDSIKMFWGLLKIRYNDLRGKYSHKGSLQNFDTNRSQRKMLDLPESLKPNT